eukprot:Gregarina_sp_Pseudo_9__5503@NODE_710_length_2326_cov_387_331439_g669_i0_p2_GENE_NODE_710_length_2326_cov_387_331439_g669_i0NODE_710_length_2326_cov_387_331439_g669_i0_p2_ORF_typecomplete_len249_score37_17_NODE_710_length_2326_cov_387_331439_g669_i015802269
MLFRLVALSAAVALTQAAPAYSDFTITNEATECQIDVCKIATGPVGVADIEACLDAAPAICTFSMSFVNSGTSTKVCGTGLGFSLEDLMPALGTLSAWTTGHTPTVTINQGVTTTESCDIGIYAADSCGGDEQYIVAMTPTTQPFSLPIQAVNPPSVLQAHTHIMFQLTGATPSDNCKKPITSVGFEDLALTLTVTGRVGEDGGNGNPESASAKLIAGLTLGVVAWLMY